MSLSIGIIGLPNVGKSTLFNALLKKQKALVANYPFATIEPNVGVVPVPNERLAALVKMYDPPSVVPATVSFVDIAGLVKGASQGAGLGNKFLAHIREVDALVHVLRAFDDDEIVREGSVNPDSDEQVVSTELILADIQSLQNQAERLQRQAKGGDKDAYKKLSIADRVMTALNKGVWVLEMMTDITEDEQLLLKDFHFLTSKPLIRVYNVLENELNVADKDYYAKGVVLCAKVEAELAEFSQEERKQYLSDLGIHATGLDKVIKRAYEALNLHTFFTAGKKEVRAWTIKVGTKAPQAAGVIHSDFERGFIAAETTSYKDLMSAGSLAAAKAAGLVRSEGKNYTMHDGDVVEFRFSV